MSTIPTTNVKFSFLRTALGRTGPFKISYLYASSSGIANTPSTGRIRITDVKGKSTVNYYTTQLVPEDPDALGDYDNLGRSVCISGDGNTLAIGATLDTTQDAYRAGSVYVYVRVGSTWVKQAYIIHPDGVANDYFGYSIALSNDGNTLAVGVYQDDVYNVTNNGSIFIFTRANDIWTQQAYLVANNRVLNDYLGFAVALSSDGNTLAAGAHFRDLTGVTDAGAVFIFRRTGTTWTQETMLQASDPIASDRFGCAVSFAQNGTTLAVGAFLANHSSLTDPGAVYVFTYANSTWTQQAKVIASDPVASDYFGWSVSLAATDGNTLAVGSYLADASSILNRGAVYIFTRSGTTWTQEAKLLASDGAANDYLGYAVSLSADGTKLIAGAYLDDEGETNTGSAYIFVKSSGIWSQQTRLNLTAEADFTNIVGAQFGIAVAMGASGVTVLVGSHLIDTVKGTDSGTAIVFELSSGTWTKTQHFLPNNTFDTNYDYYGNGIAVSADGNTIAVGSPIDTNNITQNYEGLVTIFTKSGSNWVQQARLRANDSGYNDYFGSAVVLSSDGNLLAVGAKFNDINNATNVNDIGVVYIFVRNAGTWTQRNRVEPSTTTGVLNYGLNISVSSSGNTMVVGANERAFLYEYQSSAWVEQALLQIQGFAVSLTSDGNMVAIGNHLASSGSYTNNGEAKIYTRSNGTWSLITTLSPSVVVDGAQFGYSVAVSTDGSTVAVGSIYEPATYVYARNGNSNNWTEQARLFETDLTTYARFGWSVSLSSNGNTLCVGAPYTTYYPTIYNSGAVYVYTRTGTTWTLKTSWVPSNLSSYATIGYNVACSADGSFFVAGSPERANYFGGAYVASTDALINSPAPAALTGKTTAIAFTRTYTFTSVVPATWSVTPTTYASINATTGVLTVTFALNVETSGILTILASASNSGASKQVLSYNIYTFRITSTAPSTLTGDTVIGAVSQTYTFVANEASTWSVSPTTYGNINSNTGVLTVTFPAGSGAASGTFTVTATNANSETATQTFSYAITALVPVFTTHTFTNATATGAYGPTLTNVQTAYNTTNWASSINYLNMTTQGIQVWTVPFSGNYNFIVAGARGGVVWNNPGGAGRVVAQDGVSLIKGQKLYLVVGQHGGDSTVNSYGADISAGGGGGSFVYIDSVSRTNCILVAGGGGGSSWNGAVGDPGQTGTSGTDGANGSNGGKGGNGPNGSYAGGTGGVNGAGGGAGQGALQGNAGTNLAGGNGGQDLGTGGAGGGGGMGVGDTGATFLGGTYGGKVGGFGGGGAAGYVAEYGGRGGGGGYSGGGGGGGASNGRGGGGGSYSAYSTGYNNNYGTNAGHGYITITYVAPNTASEWSLIRASALTLANSAGVSTWGVTRAFSQATSANQPVYYTSGGYVGGPYVAFNRANSTYLAAGSQTVNLSTNGGFTFFCLFKFVGSTVVDHESLLDMGNGSQDNNIFIGRVNSTNGMRFILYQGTGTLVSCDSTHTVDQDEWCVISCRYTKAVNLEIYKNNELSKRLITSTDFSNRTLANNNIGRTQWLGVNTYLNGQIAKMIIYDRALSNYEMSLVYANMVEIPIIAVQPDNIYRSTSAAAYSVSYTFATYGDISGVTWSLSPTTYGNIGSSTGVLTLTFPLGTVASGTFTVTATNAAGSSTKTWAYNVFTTAPTVNTINALGVTQWVAPTTGNLSVLIVAGGGGGGGAVNRTGGGGGGGGVIKTTVSVTAGVAYKLVVGKGGLGGVTSIGGMGDASSFAQYIALGGGGGGGNYALPDSGGSGGGGGHDQVTGAVALQPSSSSGGYGNSGGSQSNGYYSGFYAGAGGGGAGGAGGGGSTSAAGAGGAGIDSSLTGSVVYYAGGGGGGGQNDGRAAAAGPGGTGGGGAGGYTSLGSAAVAGSNATFYGGGGGGGSTGGRGGAGYQGVVIFKYANPPTITSATPASISAYTISTVTVSYTFTSNQSVTWSLTPTTYGNINSSTGALTLTFPANTVASGTFTVTATNADGETSTVSWTYSATNAFTNTSATAAASPMALRYSGVTADNSLWYNIDGTPQQLYTNNSLDGGGWVLLYETVNATRDGTGAIVYSVNNSSILANTTFDRIGYYMQNNMNNAGTVYWAFTSFDAYTKTVTDLRVPSNADTFSVQRNVTNLNVETNHPQVSATKAANGRLEIWSGNYNTGTFFGDGNAGIYDIDDTMNAGQGYGSFQVHNISALKTVMAWNNHGSGTPDIGFGNNDSTNIHYRSNTNNTDWTFAGNGAYNFKLQIYIRPEQRMMGPFTPVMNSTTASANTTYNGVTYTVSDLYFGRNYLYDNDDNSVGYSDAAAGRDLPPRSGQPTSEYWGLAFYGYDNSLPVLSPVPTTGTPYTVRYSSDGLYTKLGALTSPPTDAYTTVTGTTINGSFISIGCSTPQRVYAVELKTTSGNYPTEMYVIGSLNNSTWYQVDYRTIASAPSTRTKYVLTSPNAYSYYRFVFTKASAAVIWMYTFRPFIAPSSFTALTLGTISGSTLLNQYDALNAASITQSGGLVSAWGNMSQATGSAQPSYSATGLNGSPMIVFGSTGKIMTFTGSSTLRTVTLAYVCCASPQSASLASVLATAGSWVNGSIHILHRTDAFVQISVNSASSDYVTTFKHVHNTPYIAVITINMNASTGAITSVPYFNGVAYTSFAHGSISTSLYLGMGSVNIGNWSGDTIRHLNGGLGEILVYNTVLSDADVKKVEGYLALKWFGVGDANPLPASHPYKHS